MKSSKREGSERDYLDRNQRGPFSPLPCPSGTPFATISPTMPKGLKDEKYTKGSVVLFTEADDSLLDTRGIAYLRRLILDTARSLERPTRLNVSEKLGIDRNRLTRLLVSLKIEEEYDEIKRGARARK